MTAVPIATAAQSRRGLPDPGASVQANATVAASIRPVGVNPASAVQKPNAQTVVHNGAVRAVRSRSIVAATHGRQP